MTSNASSVSYRVRVLPRVHQLDVEMTIVGPPGDVHLAMPTWVPGAYGFMRYGRDLIGLRAADLKTGADLPVHSEGWQNAQVSSSTGQLRVTYRAYVFDAAWGELGGLVDHEHAILLGTHYFQVTGHQGTVQARYELPEGWRVHHPAGARATDGGFQYASFAQLLDTPVVTGAFELRTRSCEGTPFHFAFVDRAVGFETEVDGFIDAVMKVAAECRSIFGSFPFEHYTFVLSFNPTAHWGLEHASSTMIGLGETCLVEAEQRARGIRVCAHELFHAWNVCTLKPFPFGRYEPGGAFTEGLWIAEGFTRYYEFLLCVRSGALTPNELFSNVVNYYRHLEAMPAYERVSAIASSRDTFLNHHRYPGSINSTIDYYDKGMLIAFDIDAQMRMSSQSTSLDREFAAFYEAFVGRGLGFTTDDALKFFGRAAPGLGDLLTREVTKPGGLSTPHLLERLGFSLERKTSKWLGIVLKENAGPVVANVLDDGPVAQTGLGPDDELLRLSGFPFNLKALKWLIAHGRPFTVEVKRGHRLLSFVLEPGERTTISAVKWNGTDAQTTTIRDWLKRDFAPKSGEALPLTSFENFHGIQTVI